MDIHVNLEEERVHLKSGRSTWGLMCYEGVHGDERGMLRIISSPFETSDRKPYRHVHGRHGCTIGRCRGTPQLEGP